MILSFTLPNVHVRIYTKTSSKQKVSSINPISYQQIIAEIIKQKLATASQIGYTFVTFPEKIVAFSSNCTKRLTYIFRLSAIFKFKCPRDRPPSAKLKNVGVVIIIGIIMRNEQNRVDQWDISLSLFQTARGGHGIGWTRTISTPSFHFPREGPRRPLFYIRGFRREIRSCRRTQETRRLRQVTKNGSEDGLHYLVLSLKGTTLAAVRAI